MSSIWAAALKCKAVSLPFSYLGFPLGARPCSKAFWNTVVEKIEARLAPWKRRFRSKSGKLVLIKSVISSIPIYFMSVFKIPVGIAQRIEKIQKSFLWGDGGVKKKLHAVNWDQERNIPLFFTKSIASLIKENSRAARVLNQGTKVIIGDRARASFWKDIRIESNDLRDSFPRIYALATIKEGPITDFGHWEGDKWKWSIPLRRSVFGWEQSQWDCFLAVLQCVKIRRGITDVLAWNYNLKGVYSVSSFCRAMEEQYANADRFVRFIWQGICPPKLENFVWQLLKERIMVRQAWRIWSKSMASWGVHSCSPNSIVEWAACWSYLCPSPSSERVWNLDFFAAVWTIWDVRNQKVFKEKDTDFTVTVDTINFHIVCWYKYHGAGSHDPITSILLNIPDLCKDPKKSRKRKAEEWTPPDNKGLKFNVDGSVRGNLGPAGIGGVLRDSRGKVLCLFSLFMGSYGSNLTELLAIKKRAVFVSRILLWFANRLKLVSFNSRSSNSVADQLTKKGSSQEGDMV
ncbi:hypothetical protein Dsin_013219 [Dipteronia sinensis]|uniref:Uncharacterized protein n=1 Tax=Dipteronia sinensis TaxID=43782 RepID=A0AAE0E8X2_9ROSI|nr:hypothetical protein Dsin_013219 [Dipteronia sinensis]